MDWSHHYYAIAQEQQRGVNMIPDRMPTLNNCKEMIEHGEMIMLSLDRMKGMITQQEIQIMDQRMREQGGKGGDYDDDMTIYGDNMDKHGFGTSEGKKQRRGVRPYHFPYNAKILTKNSEQHHPDDATAAIEQRPLNGGVVQMEHEHFATPVGCTMQN
jgi:hypothetical protein